ncbi:MAG: nucleotidyltransferase domain-containing protein [Bacteroidia bacterium]|nr:nucleotidyltransferase domain-containing protein [Bacteroidia bacterium]
MRSTQIWFAYPERWRRALRAWAEILIQKDPAVLAVILYGSLARGEAHAWSDADILILLRYSTKSFKERIGDFLPYGLPLPVEAFPYTEAEAQQMIQSKVGPPFAAAREGYLLAATPEGKSIWEVLRRLGQSE